MNQRRHHNLLEPFFYERIFKWFNGRLDNFLRTKILNRCVVTQRTQTKIKEWMNIQ